MSEISLEAAAKLIAAACKLVKKPVKKPVIGKDKNPKLDPNTLVPLFEIVEEAIKPDEVLKLDLVGEQFCLILRNGKKVYGNKADLPAEEVAEGDK